MVMLTNSDLKIGSLTGSGKANPEYLNQKMTIDPITFEIIRHRLEAINDEQAITMKSVSGSPIVTEAADFNNGIFTNDGRIVSVGPQVMYHAGGTMYNVLKNVINDCQENPGIGKDDMFVVNDPYKGAVHAPDITVLGPIFYKDELIGWTGACAHQIDIGGMMFGSWCVGATEKQQEGMMLPPIKLVEGGVLRKDIWQMILGMSRLPELIGLDLKGMIASNNVAKERMLSLIEEYGLDAVQEAMEEMIRFSERKFRERLLELPDGVFHARGFMDHDGIQNNIYVTDLKLTKMGDVLRFDFSESSEQAQGFVNCTKSGLIGGLFSGFAPILAHDIPWSEGLINAIEVIAPEGLVCNAKEPAPCGAGTCSETWMVENTTTLAVSKLVSTSEKYRHLAQGVTNGSFPTLNIGGINQYGSPFGTMLLDAIMGGDGAWANRDGFDQGGCYCTPMPNIADVESNENFAPLLYLYRKSIQDTGGAGKYRGGRAAGLALIPHDVERVLTVLTTHGVESPVSPGVFGGFPGACNHQRIIRNTNIRQLFANQALPVDVDGKRVGKLPLINEEIEGEVELLNAKPGMVWLNKNDIIEYTWQGGGGYGDPLERSPGAVSQDVKNNIVSKECAELYYGVALEGDGNFGVNYAKTETLRIELRRQRLQTCQEHEKFQLMDDQMPTFRGIAGPLELKRVGEKDYFYCSCGTVLSEVEDNWKEKVLVKIFTGDEIPPFIVLHQDLSLRGYYCPACGKLLSVEPEKKTVGSFADFNFLAVN